jgi:hypothetical protein
VGFALPLGNGLIVRKVMECKKLLAIKLSAKIQMCVELISQLVFHKIENAKCALIFNKTKNLSSDDFC